MNRRVKIWMICVASCNSLKFRTRNILSSHDRVHSWQTSQWCWLSKKVAGHALVQFFINLLPVAIAWTLVMRSCWLSGRISPIGFSNEQVKLLRNVCVCLLGNVEWIDWQNINCWKAEASGDFFPKTILNVVNSLVSFYCGCHSEFMSSWIFSVVSYKSGIH